MKKEFIVLSSAIRTKIHQKKKQRLLKLLKVIIKYPGNFVDFADSFIEYIHSLDINKTQKLDNDLKANGWGVKSLLEVENAFELLNVFQIFYYLNGRFPDGEGKMNLKRFYEMFKDTNSDGLVSLQFLCALGIFSGVDKSIPKSTITELYRNLSYETFSGARDLSFPAVSDLILEVNF